MKKIFVIIFTGILIIFSAFNILKPATEFSEMENRYLKKKPEFSFESLFFGDYTEEIEKYVTDQIALRDMFVSVKSNAEKLFGKKENNKVYFCDDGYLIDIPPKYDEEILSKNIKGINDLAKSGEYNVYLSLVPTAYEILKEKLPLFAYNDVQKRVMEYVDENLKNANLIDHFTTLKLHKDEYLYYRTDHHQTMHGSFFVYQDIMRSMGDIPYEKKDFEIKIVSDEFYGTTWSKSSINTEPDKIIKYEPYAVINYETQYVDTGKTVASLYIDENLNIKDKYTYYLGGNNSIVNIKTTVNNGKKIAVIKDSYAHSVIPLLANHFEEIYIIDLRYYNYSIFEFLNENNIDNVLFLYNITNFLTDTNLVKISAYLK